MIIDSHAHVFEKWSGACGLPSRALHWRYLQKNLCRPAAKVFRARDGAPSEASHLFRPGTNGWDGLRDDIDFRVGPWGRIEFTVAGEDHYVQYMPVAMAEIEFDARVHDHPDACGSASTTASCRRVLLTAT